MGGELRKLHRVGDVHAEAFRDLTSRVGQHHALDTAEVLQNDRTVGSSPIRGCFCKHECANNLDSKLELLDSVFVLLLLDSVDVLEAALKHVERVHDFEGLRPDGGSVGTLANGFLRNVAEHLK